MTELDLRPGPLDRAIESVAPGWAARRMRARLRIAATRAYFDGATTGRRSKSIRWSNADSNVVSQLQGDRLRSASRDLVRNNAHAKRAVEAIVGNTVGRGVTTHFLRNGVRAPDIEELAKRSLETKQCDSDGLLTYRGLQALALRATVEGGEAMIRRRHRRLSDGLEVPVQFQVLESDYLDRSKDGPVAGGGRIVQGVEFDALGRRRQYWLFSEHPGSRRLTEASRPVPARDIAHAYRVDRPGQVRGIVWGAPVILAHADFHDYEDAQVMRQKIAACFAVFWREPFDSAISGSARSENDEIIDSIEPGMIERLPPGSEVEFGSPPSVEGYGEYSSVTLHKIAMGWGVSYEALTGDLRGVNFSSGKMGRLEFERNIGSWQQNIVLPMVCDPMAKWWLEAAALAGADTSGVTAHHITPQTAMIDPPREGKAEREAIRSGQKTFSEVIRGRGRDPVDHLREYAEDLKLLDELGITLDSDARVRTNAGLGIPEGSLSVDDSDADDPAEAIADRVAEILAERGVGR